ncbi:transposase, partial [Streptomyces sp. NPDC057686]|uniref:transposase n=1 Tax=Streptomyces sp. NPDC057686 TaxID=3346212 RepID=UPI0036BEF27C
LRNWVRRDQTDRGEGAPSELTSAEREELKRLTHCGWQPRPAVAWRTPCSTPTTGPQYGSRAFAGLCDQLGVTRSMGAVGTSADNAACESFHASLKRETLQGARDYGDATTCRRTVFAWLTRYNTRRRHSANGHLSPNEYERRHHTAKLTLAA